MKCGLVGLPNTGKSTLFNALTGSDFAKSENFPFCTIEPNLRKVMIPDDRLYILKDLYESQKIIGSNIEFVDIAGLVAGASKGEGLGNKFLAHIREVDAILHVVRCFDDKDIIHVDDKVDPVADKEIIDIELILSDIESLERQLERKSNKLDPDMHKVATMALKSLEKGIPVRSIKFDSELQKPLKMLNLITSKPVLYVCNVLEKDVVNGNNHVDAFKKSIAEENADYILIDSKTEADINGIDDEDEKKLLLEAMGLEISALKKLIKSAYKLLSLHNFFTCGPKEIHSWTIPLGCEALKAAGKIHTDIEKGFIAAEVMQYNDIVEHKTESAVKEQGKLSIEGKNYIVQDGDIINFRFNVSKSKK